MSEGDLGDVPRAGAPAPVDHSARGDQAEGKRPVYSRLLRLRHIAPSPWQRAALGEGSIAAAVLLVLADLASAWTLVVLPVAVALVVKAHDLTAGVLVEPPTAPAQDGSPHP